MEAESQTEGAVESVEVVVAFESVESFENLLTQNISE